MRNYDHHRFGIYGGLDEDGDSVDLRLFELLDIVRHEVGVPLADVIAINAVMEQERANDLKLQNDRIKSEQLDRVIGLLGELVAAIRSIPR